MYRTKAYMCDPFVKNNVLERHSGNDKDTSKNEKRQESNTATETTNHNEQSYTRSYNDRQHELVRQKPIL